MPVAVELYAERHVLLSTLEIGRQRLSDYLNNAAVDTLVLDEAWIGDLLQPEAPPGRLAPANCHKRDVFLAAALDPLAPAVTRSGYQRTTTHWIAAVAGPYAVAGELHLPPGTPLDIRRLFGPGSRTFVPLTGARLSHLSSPAVSMPHPVLLVRADRVSFSGVVADPSTAVVPVIGALLTDRLRALTGGAAMKPSLA